MPILNAPTGGAQPTQRPNPISTFVPITFQYGPLDRDTFTKAYFQQRLPKHPIDQSILSLDSQQSPDQSSQSTWAHTPQEDGLSDLKDPKVISEIMSYANLSVQEMHARGVQPQIISFVERNREQLRSTLETQRSFAQGIQNAALQSQPCSISNPAAMGN
ncbi:hypothetical protein GSI_05648 [Ganoderma sinense ZZ0214-1]|uniref:Uncharacterized protein n=1 Tax=Ganoderma sinense ZZ0214-1 TaxID=1077348 RepID=A0A2G8SF59_9APHY|nr:hypothetical protein GSI_05648 [Ganoderma sinense ZZ0214-1]